MGCVRFRAGCFTTCCWIIRPIFGGRDNSGTDRYFHTMQIPPLAVRDFNVSDTEDSPQVMIEDNIAGRAGRLQQRLAGFVGTVGGTLMIADTPPGATVVPVSSTEGFLSGQTITIGRGKEAETAIIFSSTRRVPKTLVLSAPLTHAHATGSEVSGTGITLSTGLKAPHGTGEILLSEPGTLIGT